MGKKVEDASKGNSLLKLPRLLATVIRSPRRSSQPLRRLRDAAKCPIRFRHSGTGIYFVADTAMLSSAVILPSGRSARRYKAFLDLSNKEVPATEPAKEGNDKGTCVNRRTSLVRRCQQPLLSLVNTPGKPVPLKSATTPRKPNRFEGGTIDGAAMFLNLPFPSLSSIRKLTVDQRAKSGLPSPLKSAARPSKNACPVSSSPASQVASTKLPFPRFSYSAGGLSSRRISRSGW